MNTDSLHTEAEWGALCKTVKESIPEPIGNDAWELVIAAALITSPKPELLSQFYTYLLNNDACYRDREAQGRLSSRLRDTLLKSVTLVGAPQVFSALMPLAKAEGNPEGKAARSSLSPKWQNVDISSCRDRGQMTTDTIYGALLPKIFQSWGDHTSDFQFTMLFGIYGLYLSDNEVMTPLEAEAVAFTAISCLGLKGPGLWHMRGMGRLLGARGSDDNDGHVIKVKDMLRTLKTGIMAIVDWVGEDYVAMARLDTWANVGDVSRELGGWGDDRFV